MSIANLLSESVKEYQNIKCNSIETVNGTNKDWAEYTDVDWANGFTTTTPSGRVVTSSVSAPIVQPLSTETTTMTNDLINENSIVIMMPLAGQQGSNEAYYFCTYGTLFVTNGECEFGLSNPNQSGGSLTGTTFTFDYFIIN